MDALVSSVKPPHVAGRRGSVTSAAVIFTQDTSGYGAVAVQVTSAGTSCTITYEASNDNATWTAVAGYAPDNTGSLVPATTSTTAGLRLFPCLARYFRARVSTYGSGTVSVAALFRKDDLPRNAIFVAGDAASTTTKEVVGDAAHDAAIAGNPLRIGARALASNYTAVSTGDTADLVTTLVGALIQKPFSIPEHDWTFAAGASGIVNTATAVAIKAAAGAGLRNYLTGLQVATDTLGGATELVVRDGAAGPVIWRGKLQTAALSQTSIDFPVPLRSTANTLLEVATLSAVTGGVYVNAQGYIAPVTGIVRTRTDLIERAATELGVLPSGQPLSDEDAATIGALVDPLTRQLSLDGIVDIADSNAIAVEYFLPLARLLANEAAPSFGIGTSLDAKLENERQLRRLAATSPTREPLRAVYF